MYNHVKFKEIVGSLVYKSLDFEYFALWRDPFHLAFLRWMSMAVERCFLSIAFLLIAIASWHNRNTRRREHDDQTAMKWAQSQRENLNFHREIDSKGQETIDFMAFKRRTVGSPVHVLVWFGLELALLWHGLDSSPHSTSWMLELLVMMMLLQWGWAVSVCTPIYQWIRRGVVYLFAALLPLLG